MGIITKFREISGRKKDFLVAAAFFIFHVCVNYKFSYPDVRSDTTLVFLQPIRFLFEHGTLVRNTSSNFYTGNPLFAIPIFETIGYTPLNFKIFMSVMMGLSTVVLYFFYKKAFDRTKAICLTLILLTLNVWLTFRYMDWTYILFFEGVILYLYTSWVQNKSWEMYPLAFFSGIAFYFKTIVLYLIVGMFVNTLIEDGKDFISEFELKEVGGVGICFLAGLSPFVVYSFYVGFDYLGAASISNSLISVFVERVKHIAILSWPGIIDYNLGVGELPLYHTYVPLVISGFVLSFRDKLNKRYAVIFAVVAILSLNVVYRVSYRQLIILVPFIPILLYANLEIISLDTKQKSYLVSILAIATILISFYTVDYKLYGVESDWDIDPHSYELEEKLDIEGPVAVNYYDAYLRSSYDMDMKPIYFLSDKASDTKLNPILLKRNISLDKVPENTTLILMEDDVCNIREVKACNPESELEYKQCRLNGCGIRTHTIKERLSLNESRGSKVNLGNHTYSVYRR